MSRESRRQPGRKGGGGASQDKGLDQVMASCKQTCNLSSFQKGSKMLVKYLEEFQKEGRKRWKYWIFPIMSPAVQLWPKLSHPTQQTR